MTFKLRRINGSPPFDYEMRNVVAYSPDLQIPVLKFALPESDASKAELIKMEGNLHTMQVSWKIIDEEDSPFANTHTNVTTALEQVLVLEDLLASDGLKDAYQLTVHADSGLKYVRNGKVSKFVAPQNVQSPLTFDASITFDRGNVITIVQDEV